MKAWAYYNEFEPYCVAWLRSLIKELAAEFVSAFLEVEADVFDEQRGAA